MCRLCEGNNGHGRLENVHLERKNSGLGSNKGSMTVKQPFNVLDCEEKSKFSVFAAILAFFGAYIASILA